MEWQVSKEKLKEIQNAKVKEYFTCPNTFRSDQISWQLLIYPNGFCENESGICNIFLVANCKLNHQGTKIKYHLKCNDQANVEWSGYAYFNHKNTNHQLTNKLYTKQLLKMNQIIFKCDIDIIPSKQTKQTYHEHEHKNNNLYINDNKWCSSNSSYIVWDFQNHSEIQYLIKMPVGSFTKSPEFVLHDLQWKLRIYPNGNASFAGDVTLYLDLIQIPPQIYSLHAIISLYIPQTNTKYYKQYAFNKYHNKNYNGNVRTFNDRDSCLLIPSGYLPIQSLFTLNALNIMLSIDIRRINFSLTDTTMGKMRMLNTIKISNHISYEWKISKQQLQEFKNSKMKQMWASDKFDCWFLLFSPNGNNMYNKGKSILSLCLLELPHALGAITAKIKLKCMEFEWIHTAAFRYRRNGQESGFSSWPEDILSFIQFCQFKEEDNISFVCDIDIIAMYDRNGYEVTNEQYKETLSNKKVNRVNMSNFGNNGDDDGHGSDEKDEILSCDKETNQYETPGYFIEDDTKTANNDEVKQRNNELNELRDQLLIAMKEINKLKKGKMNNNNNNNNNNNHIESFEKWYKCNIQLPQYYDLLIENGFDSLLAVSHLTDNDLSELGITKKGHRIKILKTIETYLINN